MRQGDAYTPLLPARSVSRWSAIAAIATFLLLTDHAAFAHGTSQVIPLMPPASDSVRQGFVRVVNRSNRRGTVTIHATDDSGARFGPVSLSLPARATVHFSSRDLEHGNTSKGLPGGVGDGAGNWRLELDSDLDFEGLAYIRSRTGFLTSMHDTVMEEAPGRYRVPIFNPGSNRNQQSWLRLVNPGPRDTAITITGLDDEGKPPPGGGVRLTLSADEARTISAQQLESGDDDLTGRLGDGSGKWTLFVSSEQSIQVVNLLQSPDGNLANLSRSPYEAHQPETDCALVVERDDDRDHSSPDTAISLGNLTGVATVRAREGSLDPDESVYYRFTLDDTRTIRVELRDVTGAVYLRVLNAGGNSTGAYGWFDGSGDSALVPTLDAGTYFFYLQASGDSTRKVAYELRYSNDSMVPGRTLRSAFDLGDLTELAVVRTLVEDQVVARRNETCRWSNAFYRFTLDDIRQIRVELRDLTGAVYLRVLNAGGNSTGAYGWFDGSGDSALVPTLNAGTYFFEVRDGSDSTRDVVYDLRYANDNLIPGRTFSSAFDLGDLTDIGTGERNHQVAVRNETTLFPVAYYRFTLDDTRQVRVELRNLTGIAKLLVLSAGGTTVGVAWFDGSDDEAIVLTLDAGTYFFYVEVDDPFSKPSVGTTTSYQLRYGVGP